MIPNCKICNMEMQIDKGRKPVFVTGMGIRPRIVRVPYVCPECGKRGIAEFPENELPLDG